jgi:hypothetical protein
MTRYIVLLDIRLFIYSAIFSLYMSLVFDILSLPYLLLRAKYKSP